MKFEMKDKEGREIVLEVGECVIIEVDGREYRIEKEDIPAIEMALTKYYRELMREIAEKHLKK